MKENIAGLQKITLYKGNEMQLHLPLHGQNLLFLVLVVVHVGGMSQFPVGRGRIDAGSSDAVSRVVHIGCCLCFLR